MTASPVITTEPPAYTPGRPGTRVLVAFASRHGATREIAAAVARSLSQSEAGLIGGLSARLVPVERCPDPAAYDAVVLGSALYAGRWLESARRYAGAVAPALRGRPTWLFSSGLHPHAGAHVDGGDGNWIADEVGARGHQVFPGRVERRLLSAAERLAWAGGVAATGDFRDWGAVRAWSGEVAAQLVASHAGRS